MKIGYAQFSDGQQNLIAQFDGSKMLGDDEGSAYVDHGLSGSGRSHPSLEKALRTVRTLDQILVTKLDTLARPTRDAHDIANELSEKGTGLSLGGIVYDSMDSSGTLIFNELGAACSSRFRAVDGAGRR